MQPLKKKNGLTLTRGVSCLQRTLQTDQTRPRSTREQFREEIQGSSRRVESSELNNKRVSTVVLAAAASNRSVEPVVEVQEQLSGTAQLHSWCYCQRSESSLALAGQSRALPRRDARVSAR